MCELSYKSEKLLLSTDCINIDDLQCLFSIKREELHIKAKIEDIWKNIYPNGTDDFEMPRSVKFAYVVSFHKTILSEEDSLNISEMFSVTYPEEFSYR